MILANGRQRCTDSGSVNSELARLGKLAQTCAVCATDCSTRNSFKNVHRRKRAPSSGQQTPTKHPHEEKQKSFPMQAKKINKRKKSTTCEPDSSDDVVLPRCTCACVFSLRFNALRINRNRAEKLPPDEAFSIMSVSADGDSRRSCGWPTPFEVSDDRRPERRSRRFRAVRRFW